MRGGPSRPRGTSGARGGIGLRLGRGLRISGRADAGMPGWSTVTMGRTHCPSGPITVVKVCSGGVGKPFSVEEALDALESEAARATMMAFAYFSHRTSRPPLGKRPWGRPSGRPQGTKQYVGQYDG